ncbi:dynein axonemal light chain 1 isoform X1 [Rhincodon typus]|uniref:dynein axonemal light chain 1 isoform X1 n=1 Tax=Rhincodon typus TaxID=259920 RepID=UPI0020301A13|nr:dynein axonemal light chain 1 isoform X1 [Rhincodon typus]
MAKATTIKEALAKWEERSGEKAAEAVEVKLYGQVPPIEKMDASLSTLSNCEKLSLSTNCIEKIANLNGLKKLTILSLGRNNIKNLNGLEAVGETLEELWISYNLIEKLKGIHAMRKLQVLYMSNNLVKDWVGARLTLQQQLRGLKKYPQVLKHINCFPACEKDFCSMLVLERSLTLQLPLEVCTSDLQLWSIRSAL